MASIGLTPDGDQQLQDLIVGLRTQYAVVNRITNGVRREPGDTARLKRAGENMERLLRALEDLACLERQDVEPLE